MADKMTVEIFAEQHPDVSQQVFDKGKADGEKAERDLFAGLEKVCGEDKELLIHCYKEGLEVSEAQEMFTAKLQKKNEELENAPVNGEMSATVKAQSRLIEQQDEMIQALKKKLEKPKLKSNVLMSNVPWQKKQK